MKNGEKWRRCDYCGSQVNIHDNDSIQTNIYMELVFTDDEYRKSYHGKCWAKKFDDWEEMNSARRRESYIRQLKEQEKC